MSQKKILITGATGYIATQLVDDFRARYDVSLIDVKSTDPIGKHVDGVTQVDLLAEDLDALLPHFKGVDTVVHCAYYRPGTESSSPRDLYPAERKNVDLAYRVYQLSLEAGVKRVVAMSTNQAAKWYEQPYFDKLLDRVDPEDYPRPDRFYGWAKAAYESLGFLYACGSLGRKLENVQIRIVVPREINGDDFRDAPPERYVRELAGYISRRDLQQLVAKSIDTIEIADEYGVPFHIFYGVSDNARKFWSITNARKVIGYTPEDDSEVRFAKDIVEILGRSSTHLRT